MGGSQSVVDKLRESAPSASFKKTYSPDSADETKIADDGFQTEPTKDFQHDPNLVPSDDDSDDENDSHAQENGDDDLDSLSSLSSDDDDSGGTGRRKKRKGQDEDFMESKARTAPQRRCHYLDIPVGTSGQLTRRVYEVRLREVEACPREEQVIPKQPYLSHATTDMLILRWEMANWSDAKKITHHELQWKQPSLKKNKYLQVYSHDIKDQQPDEEEAEKEGEERQQRTEPERVEILCDNRFCTVPTSVIKQIDLRAEVRFCGFDGTCEPLIFRVRTKVGHLGWGEWSEYSEPITPLPRVCPDLLPTSSLVTCHTLKVDWRAPTNKAFGKVVTYRLFGAMLHKQRVLGEIRAEKFCQGLEKKLNNPEEEDDALRREGIEWTMLYEGIEESFGIGGIPGSEGAEYDTYVEAAQKLIATTLSESGSNPQAIGMQLGLLPSTWPFLFRVEAETGAWFHGVFHTSTIFSPVCCLWTAAPTADKPSPPVVLPYHGMVLSRSITLHFTPPKTYGNGHDVATHRLMFPFKDQTSWFGADITKAVHDLHNKKKKPKQQRKVKVVTHDWGDMKQEFDRQHQAKETNARSEGWDFKVDPVSEQVVWTNSLTGEESWTDPELEHIPITEYILEGRLSSSEIRHKFKEYYRGPRRHVELAGLRPDTAYEFRLMARIARNSFGLTEKSKTVRYRTAEPAKEKVLLPLGWVELWDPTTEFVYYHHRVDKKIQWEHPCGTELDDLDLPFRKKRFKLLHRLYARLPPAENMDTLKLRLTRENMFEESYTQFALLPVKEMNRKLNIEFAGEDGIDSGGITTEWFLELSKKFFEPGRKLTVCHEACQLHAIEPLKTEDDVERREMVQYYGFLGRVLAKAIYDKRLLCAPFCSFVWKHLLNQEPTMEDLQQVDPLFHQSLIWILDNDITDILFEAFVTIHDGKEHELVPGGADIDVTEDNKEEYVDKVVSWRLSTAVTEPLESFKKGFYEIIPLRELENFQVEDIELLINGSSEIPVHELRRVARYANGYTEKSKPVMYFWNVFQDATPFQKGGILAFITGSTKMPLDELSIQIVKSDDSPESLPHSHTCFHQLVFPVYESQQQLQEKLFLALENSDGFYMS